MDAQEITPLMLDLQVGQCIVNAMRVRHVEREELGVSERIAHRGILLSEVPIDVEYVLFLRCHALYFTIVRNQISTTDQRNRGSE